MRRVSPPAPAPSTPQCPAIPVAAGHPSHLTCQPLGTPGWPHYTRRGGSGAAAHHRLGVCQTSTTSSDLRERAGGDVGHPLPCRMGTSSPPGSWAAPAQGKGRLSTTGGGRGGIRSPPRASWSQGSQHHHPTLAASTPLKQRQGHTHTHTHAHAPQPPAHPWQPREMRNAASHLGTR